jgi:hypothetical protein
VKAGALIPAGQVWGGDPVTYVRELTDEELLANYTKSYTNGAAEFSSESNLWPHAFDSAPADGQSIQDYADEKYF